MEDKGGDALAGTGPAHLGRLYLPTCLCRVLAPTSCRTPDRRQPRSGSGTAVPVKNSGLSLTPSARVQPGRRFLFRALAPAHVWQARGSGPRAPGPWSPRG